MTARCGSLILRGGQREVASAYMKWFRVILHGTGICLRSEDGSAPAIGFYTSRGVRADCAEEAIDKAKRSVLSEWEAGEYKAVNSGETPLLTTDTVEQIGFWQARKIPNRGHTFYTEE